MRIDTQACKKHVIEEAAAALDVFIGIEMEISLVPLYKDEPFLVEIISLISDKGYTLMSLEPGHYNPRTAQLFQVDCIFFRE